MSFKTLLFSQPNFHPISPINSYFISKLLFTYFFVTLIFIYFTVHKFKKNINDGVWNGWLYSSSSEWIRKQALPFCKQFKRIVAELNLHFGCCDFYKTCLEQVFFIWKDTYFIITKLINKMWKRNRKKVLFERQQEAIPLIFVC